MKTPPKTLLFGLIVVVVLVCLAGAATLLLPLSLAEKVAAKLRVGMTLDEAFEATGDRGWILSEKEAVRLRVAMTPEEASKATGTKKWISQDASVPRHYGDGSWLNVEFSVAPHRVVAIHAFPPDLRRRLRANFTFLQELLPIPRDPARSDPRPLRPHPPEEAPR